MAKYKVVKEINWGSGFYHDKNDNAVPMNNYAPKVGEIIELGEVQTITRPPLVSVKGFLWEFKPVSKLDSYSSQIIPLDSLELVDENLQTKSDSVSKYVFKEDFEAIGTNTSDESRSDFRSIKLKHKFKKGEVFEGKIIPINAGANPEAKAYNVEIITPNNFTGDERFVMYNGVFQVPERVVSKQTFLQKHKNHLLIVGALVIGYLAYKKFNK
jgi:hypothetical protein